MEVAWEIRQVLAMAAPDDPDVTQFPANERLARLLAEGWEPFGVTYASTLHPAMREVWLRRSREGA